MLGRTRGLPPALPPSLPPSLFSTDTAMYWHTTLCCLDDLLLLSLYMIYRTRSSSWPIANDLDLNCRETRCRAPTPPPIASVLRGSTRPNVAATKTPMPRPENTNAYMYTQKHQCLHPKNPMPRAQKHQCLHPKTPLPRKNTNACAQNPIAATTKTPLPAHSSWPRPNAYTREFPRNSRV
eukprot:COSAG02_NODE_2965_length_7644_cov_1362.789927_8_plen_180_part_00